MKRSSCLAVFVCLAVPVTAAEAGTSNGAGSYATCTGTIHDPSDNPWSDISATNLGQDTACAQAKKLVRSATKKLDATGKRKTHVGNWRCIEESFKNSSFGHDRLTCRSKHGRRVRAYLYFTSGE